MSINIFINGFMGRMGQNILEQAKENKSFNFIGGCGSKAIYDSSENELDNTDDNFKDIVSKADVIIDFSNDLGNEALLNRIKSLSIKDKGILIGSTGLKDSTLKAWDDICSKQNISVLVAPNTSLGVLLTMKLSKTMAKVLKPLDLILNLLRRIINLKRFPSGTAIFLAML